MLVGLQELEDRVVHLVKRDLTVLVLGESFDEGIVDIIRGLLLRRSLASSLTLTLLMKSMADFMSTWAYM